MTIRRKQMKSRVFPSCHTGIFGMRWLIGALAFCLLVSPDARAQDPAIEGQPVASIAIVDPAGQVVPEASLSLPLVVNKPFDYSSERESIRALYRTGDFADVQVQADESADGLHLRFIVTRNFYNNVVRVEGLKAPPTEAAALAAMRLNLGEPFRDSALHEAVDRLKDTLRAEGLFQSDVRWILTPHPDTRQMDVLIIVAPGPRATIGSFVFKNQTPFPDAELIRHSGVQVETPFTSARITRASQKLKKYLV